MPQHKQHNHASGTTSIGSEAFKYCMNLGNVVIGEGVTSIGDRAFRVCTSLRQITVGATERPQWVPTLSSACRAVQRCLCPQPRSMPTARLPCGASSSIRPM